MSTKIYLVTWCHFLVAGIQPNPGIATKYILKRVHRYSGLRILDSDTENKIYRYLVALAGCWRPLWVKI
jgi:hypothetical protein